MTVPFPRTVPDDAPTPPEPLLDQRAARIFFDDRRRTNRAIGYRLSPEGITLTHERNDGADEPDGGPQSFHSWGEVRAFVDDRLGRPTSDDPDDPSRRDKRKARRRARREDR